MSDHISMCQIHSQTGLKNLLALEYAEMSRRALSTLYRGGRRVLHSSMSWHKIGQFQATRCYADNFDEEVEELRVQQIADQEIPPPADDTVHEVLNIKAFGYDCTLVEHFAQYTHNLSKNMSLSVFDSYALPAKATLVHAIQGTGLKEKDRIKDYTLTTYQRVIQIQDLPSKRASLLLDLLQLNLPEGVSFTITPHTQEHYKERFIRKEIPDSLL